MRPSGVELERRIARDVAVLAPRVLENRSDLLEGGQAFLRRRRRRRSEDRGGGHAGGREKRDRAPHASLSGNDRNRFPVAAKTALATAGAIGGVPGSPTPPDFSVLSTMYTSIVGISFMRTIG